MVAPIWWKRWGFMRLRTNIPPKTSIVILKRTFSKSFLNCNLYLQLRTYQWIQITSYICTGRIFDRLMRTLSEIPFEKSCQRFVALIFMLLLVPFESKLVNFPTHCQCLKTSRKLLIFIAFEANRTQKSHFKEHSRNHWGSDYRPISTQKVPKEA